MTATINKPAAGHVNVPQIYIHNSAPRNLISIRVMDGSYAR